MTPNPSLPRVALITGGARRVGRAIAKQLAEDGFDLLFTYQHSAAEADTLSQALAEQGRQAVAVQVDFADPQTAARIVHDAWSANFDRLDVLVNNASIYEPGTLGEIQLDAIRRMWAINVESPLLLCQTFAGALRATGGQIVNMLDILAEKPWPRYLAYCASKAALQNVTLSLARELAPDVTVNGISPGVVAWAQGMTPAEQQTYLKRVPLARAGTPEDVAHTAHFLCTAGNYITGQIINLDGGRSLT